MWILLVKNNFCHSLLSIVCKPNHESLICIAETCLVEKTKTCLIEMQKKKKKKKKKKCVIVSLQQPTSRCLVAIKTYYALYTLLNTNAPA